MKKADGFMLSGAFLMAAGLMTLCICPIAETTLPPVLLLVSIRPISNAVLPSVLTILGAGVVCLALGHIRKREELSGPVQDDRTTQTVDTGFRYSCYCTFVGMLLLISLGSFVSLNAPLAIFIALCWMAATIIVFQEHHFIRRELS